MTKRENALLAYQHKQPEWVPCMFDDIQIMQAYTEGERYAGHEAGTDWFGVEWTYVPSVGAPMPTPGKELLDDITEWKNVVKIPDLDAIDWAEQAKKDMGMVYSFGEGLKPMDGNETTMDKLIFCLVANGPFERLHSLMNFENALMSLVSEPEACYDFFGAVADFKIKYYEKIAKYYPAVDIINQHDDYGSQDRTFMSLDTWRKLLKPHLKRMVDACHDLGMLYQHHSCGYIEPLIDDFVEIGFDALDILQVCNTNISSIKKRLGDKLTFCGGLDNQRVLDIENFVEEDVRKEYRRVIDLLAPGGSYVMFPSGVKMEYLPILLDEHSKYGVNFYKNLSK